MRSCLLVLMLGFFTVACSNAPVNDPEELRTIAGTYYGTLELSKTQKMEVQLELKPNGFYVVNHKDLQDLDLIVRENGVFIYQDQEVQLARRQNGFRYFRYVDDKLFCYNLFHEPYTNFSDSSFYLRRR